MTEKEGRKNIYFRLIFYFTIFILFKNFLFILKSATYLGNLDRYKKTRNKK